MRKFFNYDDGLRAIVESLENNRVVLSVFSQVTEDLLLHAQIDENQVDNYLSAYMEVDISDLEGVDIGGSE